VVVNRILGFSAKEMKSAIWSSGLDEIMADTGSRLLYHEDEFSVQVSATCGKLVWMRYRLRDRSTDGPGWRRTPLVDWDYDREIDRFDLGRCVEESVYCLDPRVPLGEVFSKKEAGFISNPFELLPFENPTQENLKIWLQKWKKVFLIEDTPFPGYFCLRNIKGVRSAVAVGVNYFLRSKGYEYISAVPTWWHIANMLHRQFGFEYFSADDLTKMDIIRMHLPLFSKDDRGRRKESWVVMLQFWAKLASSRQGCT